MNIKWISNNLPDDEKSPNRSTLPPLILPPAEGKGSDKGLPNKSSKSFELFLGWAAWPVDGKLEKSAKSLLALEASEPVKFAAAPRSIFFVGVFLDDGLVGASDFLGWKSSSSSTSSLKSLAPVDLYL